MATKQSTVKFLDLTFIVWILVPEAMLQTTFRDRIDKNKNERLQVIVYLAFDLGRSNFLLGLVRVKHHRKKFFSHKQSSTLQIMFSVSRQVAK
jgi:hypothetical protein